MTDARPQPAISLCIATYRRQAQLDALLGDLAAQRLRPTQIVIVDNDAAGSARATVDAHRALLADIDVVYDIQPEKNISLTRNRTVEHATGTWLAFVDDDERAPPTWLALLFDTAQRQQADGVQGPVIPTYPAHAPAWIRRGQFYDWARFATNADVPRKSLRLGNFLLSSACLRKHAMQFDPVYGVSGGEDGDLLMRLAAAGARFVWCDEAHVTEPVADNRMQARWILRRALRGGQDYAIHYLSGKVHGKPGVAGRLVFIGRAVLQLAAAALLALVTLPLGRHRAVRWLARAYANYGKLSVLWGARYREYA